MKYPSFLLVVVVCLLSTLHSCTIEKRKYLEGFHVAWTHSKSTKAENRALKNLEKSIELSQDSTEFNLTNSKSSIPESVFASARTIAVDGHNFKKNTIKNQRTPNSIPTIKPRVVLGKEELIVNAHAKKAKKNSLFLIGTSLLGLSVLSSGIVLLGLIITLLSICALFFFILTAINTYKASKEFKEKPTAYSNRSDYTLALVVTWLYAIPIIVFFLLLLLYFIILTS